MKPFESAADVAAAAADAFIRNAAEAIRLRGRFVVALSGGSTPRAMHGHLAERKSEVDWKHVYILFGDERYVPANDPNSNEGMARETFLDEVPIHGANIIGMYRAGGPDFAALAYEEALIKLTAKEPIDLIYIGLGADGHTLSLFPNTPAVKEDHRWVVPVEAPVGVQDRISMTRVPVLRARKMILLACGSDKAEALARTVNGPINEDETPCQAIVHNRPVDFFIDQAASADLSR